MSTLTDIRKAADVDVHTCVDDTCPAGHFTATTKVLGFVTTYLLAGDVDDPQATIVGRIELPPLPDLLTKPPRVWRGSGLKGGEWMPRPADSAAAFRAIVEGAAR